MNQKDSFSFAHLSDPHLTSLEKVKLTSLLNKRLLGYLSWRSRRRNEHRREVLAALVDDLQQTQPEHVVITGDLTHLGLPGEFHEAAQWLQSLGSGIQITVVPGNHDAYVPATWKRNCALWASYMVSDGIETVAADASSASLFPSLRVRGPVAFVGLSSACASLPLLATGRLGKNQLRRLQTLLQQTARQGLFRVLLIHHPPLPTTVDWRKRLIDNAALRTVLMEEGVELILHGHAHRAVQGQLQTRYAQAPVVGIPSASAFGHRPGRRAQYCLYQVQRQGQEWEVHARVRGFEPMGHRFDVQGETHWRLSFRR